MNNHILYITKYKNMNYSMKIRLVTQYRLCDNFDEYLNSVYTHVY